MESKLKHNKKRNTAFLYEVLVRELTKSVLSKDNDRRNQVLLIIKEYFSPNTALSAELKLYKSFEENSVDQSLADKFIFEAKFKHSQINKIDLFNEQTSLINTINKTIGYQIYETFLPNYKNLATISQIFSEKTSIKDKLLLEEGLKTFIVKKQDEKTKNLLDNVDSLVYKTFAKKFNEEYSSKLLGEQKELLFKYVNSFADNGLALKVYLNEEIGRLSTGVKKSLVSEEVAQDKNMAQKVKHLQKFLNEFKNADLDDASLSTLLKIQQFVHEVNNNGN
jgi:hypothetical protein